MLDMDIAVSLKHPEKTTLKNENASEDFIDYVKNDTTAKRIRALKQHKKKIEINLLSQSENSQPNVDKSIKNIQKADEDIQQLTEQRKDSDLEYRKGPINKSLEKILKKHRIEPKQFHSRSYIGNHCNKLLEPQVYNDICDTVCKTTSEMTDDPKLHQRARQIRKKFLTLNQHFAQVHFLISHKRPITSPDVLKESQHAIDTYMEFFRDNFNCRIVPKQHILEEHCVDWIERWGFGMALHGEQGLEKLHKTVRILEERYNGVRNDSIRLRLIMKEQLIQASPAYAPTPTKKI